MRLNTYKDEFVDAPDHEDYKSLPISILNQRDVMVNLGGDQRSRAEHFYDKTTINVKDYHVTQDVQVITIKNPQPSSQESTNQHLSSQPNSYNVSSFDSNDLLGCLKQIQVNLS